MHFNRETGKVFVNSKALPSDGVLFCLASWSAESLVRLQFLTQILNNYPKIDLYIYDIDDEKYHHIESNLPLKSHGLGEIFGFHNNSIIFSFSKEINIDILANDIENMNNRLF